MPPVPNDIRAAADQRAVVGDGNAVEVAADLIRQQTELRQKLRRLVNMYDRARTYKTPRSR